MADRAHLVAVCDRYVELLTAKDPEGIVALFADDAWIEDPVGSARKQGKDALRDFYGADHGVSPVMTRIGPVCVAGHEAAFQFRIDIDLGESTIVMTSTDCMAFDDDGLITSMRAYPDAEANPDA